MTVSILDKRHTRSDPAHLQAGLRGASLAVLFTFGTMLPLHPALARGEQAGVSAAVRGEVELAEAKGVVGTRIDSGQPIYLGDYITSSPGSGMQILLMDETVFTIGPNSEIAIDDFVYDPSNNQGHMTASITRGVVRVLTGKLAHNDPKTMKINLPVGSIGIRGTQFLVSVQDGPGNGGNNGTGSSNSWSPTTQKFAQDQLGSSSNNNSGPIVGVVNLGPGAGRNDSGSRPGAVELTSNNGVTQPLSSEGFGAFMTGDTVTPPTRFPADLAGLDISSLVTRPSPRDAKQNGKGNGNGNGSSNSGGSAQSSSASPTASGTGSSGTSTSGGSGSTLSSNAMASANSDSGQTVAGTLDVAMTQTSVTTTSSAASNETSQTSNDVHSDPSVTDETPGSTTNAATFEAMQNITSGTYAKGASVNNGSLAYESYTQVDFSNRYISQDINNIEELNSSKQYNGDISMHYSQSYTGRSGDAILTNEDFYRTEGCVAAGCSATVTFTTPTSVHVDVATTAVPEGAQTSYDLDELIDNCPHCGGGGQIDPDPGNAPDLPTPTPTGP
ncbi:FecR family protein [uncultured Thalassospira sp.]|uniref:FecR family protein n=1 Tax=uncultured Thalassospira sp. TaxID=404382 RepID=UPI0030D84DE6